MWPWKSIQTNRSELFERNVAGSCRTNSYSSWVSSSRCNAKSQLTCSLLDLWCCIVCACVCRRLCHGLHLPHATPFLLCQSSVDSCRTLAMLGPACRVLPAKEPTKLPNQTLSICCTPRKRGALHPVHSLRVWQQQQQQVPIHKTCRCIRAARMHVMHAVLKHHLQNIQKPLELVLVLLLLTSILPPSCKRKLYLLLYLVLSSRVSVLLLLLLYLHS